MSANQPQQQFWDRYRVDRALDAARKEQQALDRLLQAQKPAKQQRVLERARSHRRLIEDATRGEVQAYLDAAAQSAAAGTEVAALSIPLPGAWGVARRFAQGVFTLLLLALAAYAIGGFIVGWATPWTWLRGVGTWLEAAVLAVVVGDLAALILLNRRSTQATAEAQARRSQALDLDGLEVAVAAALDEAMRVGTLAANGAWNKAIADELDPLYSIHLDVAEAPVLDAGTERTLQIRTPAHADIEDKLRDMRGGAIGIAGPRGVGKSTLIGWFCGDDATPIEGRATSVLTAALSAPVDYEARDFLLHLFASVCHRVIERLDRTYRRSDWKTRIVPDVPRATQAWRAVLTASICGQVVGVLMLLLSLGWAVSNVNAQASAARAAAPSASAAGTGASSASSAAASTPAAAAAASAAKAASDGAEAPVANPSVAHELGVSAAMLFNASLAVLGTAALALLAVVIAASRLAVGPVADPRRRPIDRSDPAQNFRRQMELMALPLLGVWRWYRRLYAALPARMDPAAVAAVPDAAHPADDARNAELVRTALSWLAEIKFQQSYSMGWSGTLKMPLGLEGSLNQARQMAQQQMSLPEITDSLTRFLRELARGRETMVVIGIDELDKIESDEKAQRFLNDIKVVFGGVNVFFLVSVSENAMSQFERRGLPFRDAFDSAFDDVVVVSHLKFEHARQLLEERVLRMPVQFQALCHALSAGLPRELVRSSRDLIQAAKRAAPPGDRQLGALAQRLATNELAAKVLAFNAAAERAPAGPARNDFMLAIELVGAATPTSRSLYAAHLKLLEAAAARPWTGRGQPRDEEVQAIARLSEEFATFLYFLAGVLQVFTDALDEAAMRACDQAGLVDALAAARRMQGQNQSVARRMLDDVLLKWSRPLKA